jgi:hypothetical protein
MLNILTILIVDAKILGSLQGQAAGTGRTQFVLLVGVLAFKAFLSWRTFALAGQTVAIARPAGEKNYLGNARGAKIATLVCAAGSIAILAFGAHMAF